jgi:hypothetical protein
MHIYARSVSIFDDANFPEAQFEIKFKRPFVVRSNCCDGDLPVAYFKRKSKCLAENVPSHVLRMVNPLVHGNGPIRPAVVAHYDSGNSVYEQRDSTKICGRKVLDFLTKVRKVLGR